MAIIRKDEDGDIVFVKGRYEGETLEDVASEDPSYLQWLYRHSEDMRQDLFEKLQDVMREHEIDF